MVNQQINYESLIGKQIEIILMAGESQYIGRRGFVECIDSMQQIHGTWGGCALIPGIDQWKIINE